MSFLKSLVLVSSIALLSGCGGGGGSDTPSAPPTPPTMNPGGTPDNPSEIRLDMKNEIVENTFHNYFKYYSAEDEKLVIHVTLDKELKQVDINNCNYAGNTFIAVYDENEEWMNDIRTCGTDLTVKFPTSGEYKFKILYPYSGYFEAASIMP